MIPRIAFVSIVTAAVAVLTASAALAGTSTSLSSYDYDGRGRIEAQHIKSYDDAAELTNTTEVRYFYDGDTGRLMKQAYSTKDALGNITSRALYTNTWADGQVARSDRSFSDDAGRQTRREEDHWTADQAVNLRMRETRVYDTSDTLIETRYGIYTYDDKGRTLSRDESRYDAEGLQVGRQLDEMKYDRDGRVDGRTIHDFDKRDAITKIVEETWTYSREGRLIGVDTNYANGEGVVFETSKDDRTYDDNGRMKGRTYTFMDADRTILRQLVESLTYDGSGHLEVRRGTWEHFEQLR